MRAEVELYKVSVDRQPPRLCNLIEYSSRHKVPGLYQANSRREKKKLEGFLKPPAVSQVHAKNNRKLLPPYVNSSR
jgi:hypothetical protein